MNQSNRKKIDGYKTFKSKVSLPSPFERVPTNPRTIEIESEWILDEEAVTPTPPPPPRG